ncbi:hypothetical protein HAZT_HAZT007199 [Hyalella azteca]|uniref:SAM-dependent MTase RsmB/NOP-type domain-containing protein n=1 Tax=Hyalella azteca TaxID=294128 RepID=A0A6A0H5B0_HYAAZ|nr:hypothetical protein HAZT_HAZT007199 [Hyalella azteca]
MKTSQAATTTPIITAGIRRIFTTFVLIIFHHHFLVNNWKVFCLAFLRRLITVKARDICARSSYNFCCFYLCYRKDVREALNNRGVNCEPIPWSKVGLVVYGVPSNVPLGATPEYLAGHYILQGASSLLPVMSLAPREHEHVLDMCAAPGGKATHIASMMKNTGVLYCNDFNPKRVKALTANIHRMGVTNTIVTAMDGRAIGKSLDRVLLDAPCTGTGIISKDARVKHTKEELDVKRCSHLQAELLIAAIDANGIFIVYCNCSVLVEENEQVINSVLKKRAVKLVPTGLLNIGAKGFTKFKQHRFHPSLELMQRIYPHKNNMDGFSSKEQRQNIKSLDYLRVSFSLVFFSRATTIVSSTFLYSSTFLVERMIFIQVASTVWYGQEINNRPQLAGDARGSSIADACWGRTKRRTDSGLVRDWSWEIKQPACVAEPRIEITLAPAAARGTYFTHKPHSIYYSGEIGTRSH